MSKPSKITMQASDDFSKLKETINNEALCLFVSGSDATEDTLRQSLDRIARLAATEALTKAANRGGYVCELNHAEIIAAVMGDES